MKNLTYTSPTVEVIPLDNEISLQLQSTPPVGPEENFGQSIQSIENNPFNDNIHFV